MTMPIELNQTHNPTLKSWVKTANDGVTDFPIQNLPFGIFRASSSNEEFRGGVAIGDQILDLTAAAKTSVFSNELAPALEFKIAGIKYLYAKGSYRLVGSASRVVGTTQSGFLASGNARKLFS